MLGCLLALLALLTAWPALAQSTWTMATEYPATSMSGEGIATFARLAGERSGGRLVVTPSYDAALGIKSAGLPAAIREGRVQAGDAFGGALGGVDPVFALSSLPFVSPSIDEARRLAELAWPSYQKVAARLGQRLLYVTPWPATGVWSKRPLGGAADLAGLSVRTYDATSTQVFAGAGAKAVEISFADTMPKLKDGSIEAVVSSGDGGAGRRLFDFLPHFTEINYAIPLSIATVGAATYEALPGDLRAAIDEAAAETERRLWTTIRSRLEVNYKRMRESGVTIQTAPDASLVATLRQASRPALDAWKVSAGSDGAALLERFQAPK